jgi:predicted RNase H-like HicB family nuclease
MTVRVVLRQAEDGYFVANCPPLKSCWSQGKTREEALENIREAVALFLESQPVEPKRAARGYRIGRCD